jgi:hypothetical protein
VKHRDLLIVMMLAASCGAREDHSSQTGSPIAEAVRIAATHAVALNTPDPIAKGVPHGGTIRELAATEEGDAAITSDELDGLRLWPTLDGTRAPVPVELSSQPGQLGLFHDGRDLVAVILDSAGSVTLIRLGKDGSVRGRAQLPGDSYVEVVAVGTQVLARTSDHAVELYSADAEPIGRITPGHGERVTDLAARRGRAAAVITTDDGAFVRWITAGTELRWDVSMKLPLVPRDDMLAIAPGKRRVAFVDTGNTGVQVFDLELIPLPIKGSAVPVSESSHAIGFVDDDTAVVAGAPSVWWTRDKPAPAQPGPADPWAVTTPSVARTAPGTGSLAAVIVDRYLIEPANLSLALMDGTRTRYLGWKESAASSSVTPLADQVVMTSSSSQFTWLDDNLGLAHSFNLQDHRRQNEPWVYGSPIGAHHVLTQHSDENTVFLDLVDVDKPDERVSIGRFPRYDRHEYIDGMLAVFAGRTVRRFEVDLATTRATELRPALKLPSESVSWVRLFDPARSEGLVGMAAGWEHDYSDHQTLWLFRKVGSHIETTKLKRFDYSLIRSDATGTVVLLDKGPSIVVMRGGKLVSRTETPDLVFPVVVNANVTRIASKAGQEIIMRDGHGGELWRTSLWGANQLSFIAGGSRLAVSAPGGFVALDAATGRQLARECAWSFGLHDTLPTAMPVNLATVCEDPVVQ